MFYNYFVLLSTSVPGLKSFLWFIYEMLLRVYVLKTQSSGGGAIEW